MMDRRNSSSRQSQQQNLPPLFPQPRPDGFNSFNNGMSYHLYFSQPGSYNVSLGGAHNVPMSQGQNDHNFRPTSASSNPPGTTGFNPNPSAHQFQQTGNNAYGTNMQSGIPQQSSNYPYTQNWPIIPPNTNPLVHPQNSFQSQDQVTQRLSQFGHGLGGIHGPTNTQSRVRGTTRRRHINEFDDDDDDTSTASSQESNFRQSYSCLQCAPYRDFHH